MKKNTALNSETLFERTRCEVLQRPGLTPEKSTGTVYDAIHALDDSGDPALLLQQAQQVLRLAIKKDGALRQHLRKWIQESYARIRWGCKSGKATMIEPPAYALLLIHLRD